MKKSSSGKPAEKTSRPASKWHSKARSASSRAHVTRAGSEKANAVAANQALPGHASADDEQGGFSAWLRSFWRSSPALAFSLLLHIVVILALGIATIANVQRKQELVLTATSVEGEAEEVEEFSEVEIENVEELSMDEPVFDSALPEMAELSVSEVELPTTAAESVAQVAAASGNATGETVAAKPPAKSKRDRPSKKQAVSFYGAKSAGNRFVFICDNSASMVKGKMLTTMDQLLQSVHQMKPKQEFFVMFYSDMAYPMFYPDSVSDFMPATKQNKKRLEEWLKTVELSKGGDLESAIELALKLKPDVIFILGDGRDLGDDDMRMMTDPDPRRRCVINTLGMGAAPGTKAAVKLAAIAEANRGVFVPVQPHPAAVQLSQSVKFKINTTRGRVWGKRVK
jgi:hypothetical protein